MSDTEDKNAFKCADCVCFDVDSTVIQDEGIDVLADYCGHGKAVADWTQKAMGGNVTFRDALAARLDIMRPSLSQINDCLRERPHRFTPGLERVVSILLARGTAVYLVSGGFRRMINPLAVALGLSVDNVYANRILHDEEGNYKSFDETEPTSKAGGKPSVVQTLIDKHGYKSVVMVGDGVTDMEAKPPASGFIGFGGNRVREKVKAKAGWFAMSMDELITVLES